MLVYLVLVFQRSTYKEINYEIADAYRSSASSYAQIKFLMREFRRGRTSLEDEVWFGRILHAPDEEICKKVWYRIYSGRQDPVEELAQSLGISHSSISIIEHDR